MRDIFLKKSYTNVLNKLVSDTFNKIKIEHITELAVWSVIQFVLIVCPRRGLPKYIKTKVLTTCF